MAIYTTHGIVKNRKPKTFWHRNLLDAEKFIEHLQNRPTPYVDLDLALAGHGDAFTIDDATVASYEAAKTAREYGHEVTLFINTALIDQSLVYTSAYLDIFIDVIEKDFVTYNGVKLPGSRRSERKKARKVIKADLLLLDYNQQINLLKAVYQENDISWPEKIPQCCETITWDQVKELQALDVNIQNHGEWHSHPSSCSWEKTCRNIEVGAEKIREKLGTEALIFAVPFGDAIPASNKFPSYIRYWLMLTDTLIPDRVGLNVFNRLTLEL